jgi:hypothetical protein
MKFIEEPAKRIPVRDEADILVVGGGNAGPVAAMAAARHGKSVLLIEKSGFLGGNLIGGATGFHGFWNVYHREPGAQKVKIVEGIPQEIVDRSLKEGAGVGHVEYERSIDFNSVYTGLEPERTRLMLYYMVIESGAKVLLHAAAVGARTEKDRHIVIIESKAGREAVIARQVIDCTGDGDIAAALGAPFENFIGEKAWGTSLTFRMGNIDLERLLPWMEEHGTVRQIARAKKIGGTVPEIIRLSMKWGGKMAEEAQKRQVKGGMICTSLCRKEFTHCNCTWRTYENNLDPADLTTSEVHLRRQAQEHSRLMRDFVPGCEDCFVSSHSPTLGVRLSRIFDTEYEIPREEVLKGRHHADTIGFVSFVDIEEYWIEKAGCFGIPYRSIVPLKVDNLLLAGRMISRDYVVFQTTRNTVSCAEQGQAAGTAAALCLEKGVMPRKLDPGLLREALRADGVQVDCPELNREKGIKP